MKLSLKLAALIIGFSALLLPYVKPQTANAQTPGCQLIVSTTTVVAHGSFNVTIQNGQPGVEYVIKYDSSLNPTIFTMPGSGSFTATVNLDTIFAGISTPSSFLVAAGTTTPIVPPAEVCSPSGGITITVIAPPTPTTTITAASTTIPYNTATTLNWTSTNADTCTLNGSSVATNGSQSTGNLTTTTTFTISCTNVSGNSQSSVTVTVQPPPAPTCSPATQTVIIGANANFTASAGTGTYSWSAPNGNPTSGSGSTFATSYSAAGNQIVTVTSGTQNATCAVTVQAPPPPQITSFTATPTSVIYNNASTLSWTTTNATSCTINSASVPVIGSQSTGNLTTNTVFTLNCKGLNGATQQSVTVTVTSIPCSYNFSPTTVNSKATVTVTILTGSSSDQFTASLTPTNPLVSGSVGPGTPPMNITLTAPDIATTTTFTVAAVDHTSGDKLCALQGPTNTLTVNPPPLTWHLNQPIVASNQLSVLFAFTPASNGNIGLIVDTSPAFSSLPRPFDSGAIANGTSQVTWNFPQPGTYYAELVFGGVKVSDNVVQFTVANPPGNSWTLSINNTNGYLVVFNISPNAGGNSALLIMDSTKTTTVASLPIPSAATNMTWTGPTTASPTTYNAVINYFSVNVSNWAQFTLPVNPPATQWTLSIQSISGNDVTFNVQCPTKDCPGYSGQAVVAIKDLSGLSQPVPAGGGTVKFTGLPNGSHQAVVVVFISEESGVVNFTLPQKTSCGWLVFPGNAGTVIGPVNNCSLASPGGIISAFLPYVFGIAGFLSVIIIVISGIQFITSSGNPEAAAGARNRLVFALIGLAVIILAFAILQIVDKLFLGGSGVS